MLYSKYRILATLLGTFFLIIMSPVSQETDIQKERVLTLKNFLEKEKDYFVFSAESFDGHSPWENYRNDHDLNENIFTDKSADSEDAHKLETDLLPEIKKEFRRSFQIHTSLVIPDREKIFIRPRTKIFFPAGTPVYSFLWMHSEGYTGTAKVLLEGPGRKNIQVNMGELNFSGWKRLEGRIPFMNEIRLNAKKKKLFELKGILMEFKRNQPKGVFTLQFDRLYFLMQKSSPTYPGSEIEDGWTFKE
ncbi:MAG TPA: hypothetical protein PL163_20665 [Leptospiraceae bacterium]|nr:hypothetical protein [Leptospiraceae bacterium]